MEKYEENEALKTLREQLEAHEADRPGAYSSLWQQQLSDTLDKILNREAFSYDPAGDALYRQYRNLYQQQGRLAMLEAAGQASFMTGGYGNSYAQSVSQQAYQQSLQQLGGKLPQLYELALQSYKNRGSDLQERYSLLQQQEEADYGRYRQQLDRWQNYRKDLFDRYEAQRDFDYKTYNDQRNYDYQKQRAEAEESRWQREFEEAVRQFNIKRGIKT